MLRQKQTGFTIVELLIVIVVIAILATISIVSYTGIQNRANDAAVQADLRNFGTKIMEYHAFNGRYPTGYVALYGGSGHGPIDGIEAFPFARSAYSTESNNIQYCEADGEFGVGAVSKSGNVFYYSSSRGLAPYEEEWGNANDNCPGMLGTNSGVTQSYAYRQASDTWSAMAR